MGFWGLRFGFRVSGFEIRDSGSLDRQSSQIRGSGIALDGERSDNGDVAQICLVDKAVQEVGREAHADQLVAPVQHLRR